MLIHLMQHGACLPKELDPHQPLSPVGREQITKSARAAQRLGLRFELIVASPKVRSLQTAEIMAEAIGYPVSRIEVTEAAKAMAPPHQTLTFLHEYDGLDSVLIAGHLPSVKLTASKLLAQNETLDISVENGGLMQIQYDIASKHGALNWHISPMQLAEIAAS